MTWWIRIQTSVTDTEPSEKWPTGGTNTSRYRRIQCTDKVADESVAVQRRIWPRTTETKAHEHQQDDRSGGDADKDVQGEAITKHCWSGGKKMISICNQRFFNLTVTVCTQQFFKLIDLAHEIPGVKVAQKTWHKLLEDASTKEAVADDTANSNSLTHSPSQSWSKETKSSGFEEPVSNSTNDQDSAKMLEMWITTVDPRTVDDEKFPGCRRERPSTPRILRVNLFKRSSPQP